MDLKAAKDLHDLMIDEDWGGAVSYVELILLKKSVSVTRTKPKAVAYMRSLCQHLLDDEQYLTAATLLWGGRMFNAEPESVQRVFKALHENAKILFCGASSMGKSFNAGVWMYLDWRRDPIYTSVKCIGISEDQVRKHVFAHIAKLHRSAVIPMAEEVQIRDSDMWMGIKEAGNEFGITAIAYKQSQETSGGLKGYKSMPVRPKPHPKFGYMSRLRYLGDEGQNWPNGPFKDLNTTISQISGPEMVKIAIAFNPENTSQLVVRMSEPEGGWDADDLDRLYDWTSEYGWRVCRLDAARCENVIAKKEIYAGLQTYDGYVSYLRAGGDNSPNYWCFARGFPPMKGSVNTIIPPAWPQEQRGEAIFLENPVILGAVDLAFQGQDSAQMAVARWGLASGWRDFTGKVVPFVDRLNVSQNKPRHVLQIDQILPMAKHDDTVKMAEEIIGRAKMLGITPEWTAVDKTSIGLGTYSHLNKVWGPVLGVAWNEKATEGKILSEDKEGADKQCDGVMSEMWWALRRWLDPRCSAILINPIIPTQPIHTQLTSRRFKNGKNGIKVEAKEEYKARNSGKSPDEADAIVMLVHLVRKNSDVLPGLVEQSQAKRDQPDDEMKFIPVPKMVNADEPDSIATSDSGDDHIEP
jgi:hypothetical protein